MAFVLRPKGPVADAIRDGLLSEIDSMLIEIDDDSLDRHEVVHSVRKHAKRIRAMLRMVRPHLRSYGKLKDSVRDAAGELGSIRDAQSVLEAFERLDRAYGALMGAAAVVATRTALTTRRDALTLGDEATMTRLASFRKSMSKLRNAIHELEFETTGRALVEDGVLTAYRRGAQAMRAAYGHGHAEAFHEWRKWTKTHLHHLQLLRKLPSRYWKRRRTSVDALAEKLGEDHDLWMLEHVVADDETLVLDPATRLTVVKWTRMLSGVLREEAQPTGRLLYRDKPAKIAQRLKTDWKRYRRG